ncbi:hypothetical protein ACFO4E_17960 [Nocardiopsis mangrovi]|uniref:Uncharacterized protein n=1 Tax=Nocardiopsis mangrovi TaxID=1179818 RepID=A0ABV9DY36_9ACTN
MRSLLAVAAATASCAVALAGAVPAGAADDDRGVVVVDGSGTAYRYHSEEITTVVEDPVSGDCRAVAGELTAAERRAISRLLPETDVPVLLSEADCASLESGEAVERLEVVSFGGEPALRTDQAPGTAGG